MQTDHNKAVATILKGKHNMTFSKHFESISFIDFSPAGYSCAFIHHAKQTNTNTYISGFTVLIVQITRCLTKGIIPQSSIVIFALIQHEFRVRMLPYRLANLYVSVNHVNIKCKIKFFITPWKYQYIILPWSHEH